MNEPRLRFNEFKDEWKNTYLKNISTYNNGSGFEQNLDENGIFNVISLGSVSKDGTIKNSGKKTNKKINLLYKNDLVMILSFHPNGIIGMNAIIPSNEKYVLNQRMGLIRVNKFNNPIYIHYILNKHRLRLERLASGLSQLNLSKNDILNFKIKIPGNKEQKKIGSFFEKLDQLIQLQSNKLEHLKITKKGYLQKIFLSNKNKSRLNFKNFHGNWDKFKLSDICYSKSSQISLKNALKENNINNTYPIFDVSNLIGYLKEFDQKTKYISIIKDGSGVGKTQLRPEKSSVISTMNYILPKENIDVYFLNYYFKVLNINKYKLGTGIPHIYFKDYSKLDVSVPSFNEQQKIGQFLYKLDQQIDIQQQKINNLQQQKKAYLQKMFI